jgi:uncharacterized membrane protein YbhN (UPF0104 family)
MISPRGQVALRLGGSAVALAVLLAVIPFRDLVESIGAVRPYVWLIAIAVYLSLHFIGVLKWRLLLNTAGAGLSIRNAARCYYYGLFGNIFLPSIVGGDVVRAGLAFTMTRERSAVVLGSLVDRVLDLVGLATIAGFGILLLPRALDAQNERIFTALAAICVVMGVLAIVASLRLPVRRFPKKVRRPVVKVRNALRAFQRRPGRALAAFLSGIILQTLLVVLNAWLGYAAGIRISLVVWLFVWPMAKISGLAPLTQGGIGVREAAQVALFAPFGVSAAAAAATGLIFEAVIITGGLLGGGLAWLLGRRDGKAAAPMLAIEPVERSSRD